MDNQNNNIYSNDNVNSDDFNAGDNINVINNVNADNDNNAGNRINNSASDNRGNIGDLYGMNDLRRNAQPPRKKKSQGFASGMIIGAVSAFMAVILLILSVAAVCIAKGYIHIGVNGDVYIQSDAVTDSDGIGSEVEGKLNAIDSVLESFYFGDVDDETAKDNIYKAYLSSYGDKYTMYYTADEYKALKESTNGKFYGIGAVCQLSGEGGVLLVDVYDNGAGYQAGLRSGDRVVNVDGRDITGMELSSAVALIKGDKGTSVTLEVIRGTERLTFSAVRDAVEAKTVSYTLLDNNIGYLSISQFEEVTTKQFKAAVEDLQSQGMKGLVIDIRNNPGGLLDTVVNSLNWALVADAVEYGEYKTGVRAEGIVYSFFTFFRKCSQAVAGFVPGLVLTMVGYVPNAVQSLEALEGIRGLMFIYPGVLAIATIIVMGFFYKLSDQRFRELLFELQKRKSQQAKQ